MPGYPHGEKCLSFCTLHLSGALRPVTSVRRRRLSQSSSITRRIYLGRIAKIDRVHALAIVRAKLGPSGISGHVYGCVFVAVVDGTEEFSFRSAYVFRCASFYNLESAVLAQFDLN
jgi:hypothetical protein